MCECFQIGGPFIAEDPDCPIHGRNSDDGREVSERRLEALEVQIEALSITVDAMKAELHAWRTACADRKYDVLNDRVVTR